MLALIVIAATGAVMTLAMLVALFLDRRELRSGRRTRSTSADTAGKER